MTWWSLPPKPCGTKWWHEANFERYALLYSVYFGNPGEQAEGIAMAEQLYIGARQDEEAEGATGESPAAEVAGWRCQAYTDDGRLCGRPAVAVDEVRGIAVCRLHAGDAAGESHS